MRTTLAISTLLLALAATSRGQDFTVSAWVDMDDAYWTLDPSYIETVWWLLKQIWDKGLLEEDFRVVPYCPRCETSLSSHEQHQTDAYKDIVDPSVYEDMKLVLGNVERNDVLRALVRYSIKQDEKKPAVSVGKAP